MEASLPQGVLRELWKVRMITDGLIQKYLSRKLLITLGAVIPLLAARQWAAAAAVACTYLLGQGYVDGQAAKQPTGGGITIG